MSAKFEVQLDRETYAPGDPVRGWVRVTEGGRSRSLEVSLQYREKSPDYGSSVLKIGPVTLHQGELQQGQSLEFNLQLPPDAPPAYSSGVGQMWWAIIARSDQLGPDTVVSQRVEVEMPARAR